MSTYNYRSCQVTKNVLDQYNMAKNVLDQFFSQNSSWWKTQKTHKKQGSTKIRRERVHVKNDASTSMHFYAHPYTRKRISHTRDCNVIALNASHNIHLHIVSHILSAYFLGRGFVCMFVCRKTDALTDAR